MNYKLALKQLKDGQVKPVYVCFGEESFLLERFIQGLSNTLVQPEHKDFAVSEYDLADINIEAVLEDVQTLPFMVPRKVVIAHNALFLTAARGGKNDERVEHKLDRLLDYMQSPIDYSVLVLTVQAEKLDERKKIVKWLREFAVVLSFQPLSGHDLAIWVTTQFAQMKCKIDDITVQTLIQTAGANLQILSNEIKKIAMYAGEDSVITPEIIEQLAVRSLEQNIFKLIDDIVEKRIQSALSLLNDMLEQREDPVKILMLIVRQFRIILQVKALHTQGVAPQQIASQVKINPYFVRNAIEQGRRYDDHTLSLIMSHLANLDYEMKMGKVEKVMALELFLLKLA